MACYLERKNNITSGIIKIYSIKTYSGMIVSLKRLLFIIFHYSLMYVIQLNSNLINTNILILTCILSVKKISIKETNILGSIKLYFFSTTYLIGIFQINTCPCLRSVKEIIVKEIKRLMQFKFISWEHKQRQLRNEDIIYRVWSLIEILIIPHLLTKLEWTRRLAVTGKYRAY